MASFLMVGLRGNGVKGLILLLTEQFAAMGIHDQMHPALILVQGVDLKTICMELDFPDIVIPLRH